MSFPFPPLTRAEKTARLERELADCPDRQTERQLREELILTNTCVASSIASAYRFRGVGADDLEQIAMLALTKAAQRFDAARGHAFLSYCVPSIRGEVRRYFRDHGWMVRPPRRVQEMQAHLAQAEEELSSVVGRAPTDSELAAHLDADIADVREARNGHGCFTPTSLDERVGSENDGPSLGEMLPAEDRDRQPLEATLLLGPVVRLLSERERQIVRLRFYEDLSQQQIATIIGVTQTQVSRLLSGIFTRLRADLLGNDDDVAAMAS